MNVGNFETDLFKKLDAFYIDQMSRQEERKEEERFEKIVNRISRKTFQSSLMQFSIALVVILLLILVI